MTIAELSPTGSEPRVWGAYGGRSGLIYSWAEWERPDELVDGDVRCFACRWRATSWLRVEFVQGGWAADLLVCRRHTRPFTWRRRVWTKARLRSSAPSELA